MRGRGGAGSPGEMLEQELLLFCEGPVPKAPLCGLCVHVHRKATHLGTCFRIMSGTQWVLKKYTLKREGNQMSRLNACNISERLRP